MLKAIRSNRNTAERNKENNYCRLLLKSNQDRESWNDVLIAAAE